MDGDRFDNIARALASGRAGSTSGGLSRRRFIGGLAAAAAGLLPTRRAEAQVTQVYCGNQACASNPGGCKPGCVCCTYTNSVGQVTNSRCRPPGTCSPGTVACPPGQVIGPSGGCVCVDNGTACTGKTCGTAVNNCGATVTCGSLGGGCPSGQSCQAGTCVCPAGTCGENCALVLCPDGSCKQGATGACAGDGDCCSGICVGGACLGGCVAEGGVCDSGPDCCAGACVTPGGGGPSLCCASGTACGANCCAGAAQVCDGSGACCTPTTCQPGECGPRGDGCGRGLDCGGCTVAGETCGGGGTPGVCGSCTPADPATVCAGTCGTVINNCGQSVDCTALCPGCCTVAIDSICVAGDAQTQCGSDGERCSVCLPPDTCGGGGTPYVCGCTSEDPAVTCAGKCGTVQNNCGNEVSCLGCGGGLTCCNGECVNLSNDVDNCGACGNTCTENQPCEPCPSDQICPDRGPGCCETGTCSAGRCSSILPVCAACATPLCDPDLGAICVDNCPPPDACHTGAGVCQFDGSCTYEPTCSSCQECDPNTGTCSESPCGFDEFCVDGECVDGFVCLYLDSGDGVLCHPNDTCDVVSLAPPQTGCCPADATRCPLPDIFGDSYDLCCPAGDTCETQSIGESTLPYCSSVGPLCPPLSGETSFITCSPNETCAVAIDPTTLNDQSICCPADGVLCGDFPTTGRPLCCPAGDTCGTTELLGTTYPTCSSIGNFCPSPDGGPAIICDPDDTCAFTQLGVGGIEVGCCPPDGVICTLSAPDGAPDVPDFDLSAFELCCPAGDTCTVELAGLFLLPRCSSAGGVCPGPDGLLTCEPGEACAITTTDESTGALELGCCPADGVICEIGDLEGIPSFLALCCPAGDTCETVSGPGSFPRCSSTPL